MKSPISRKNILLAGTAPLTARQKKQFRYFGVHAQIKPPYRILNPQRMVIGDRTSIQEFSHLCAFSDLTFLMDYLPPQARGRFSASDYRYDSRVDVGPECQIGRFFFVSSTCRVTIHRHALISERVFIGDNNHTYACPDAPILQQPNSRGVPVEVGEGSWIGVGAALLKGTRLGKNSVVGANSVVRGAFPAHSVLVCASARALAVRPKSRR